MGKHGETARKPMKTWKKWKKPIGKRLETCKKTNWNDLGETWRNWKFQGEQTMKPWRRLEKKRELVEIPMNPHSFLRITMENHNFEEVYQLFPLIIWLTFIFFRGFQTTNQWNNWKITMFNQKWDVLSLHNRYLFALALKNWRTKNYHYPQFTPASWY